MMRPSTPSRRRASGTLLLGAAAALAAASVASGAGKPARAGTTAPPAGTTAASASSPASAPASALPPGVACRINGKDIPKDRFIAELDAALGESYRETFVGHVLVEDRAAQAGITASDSEIETRVKSSVDQVLGGSFGGDESRMKDALAERGMTLEGWKKRLRIESRSDVLVDKLVRKDREVSDDTLKRLYEEKYGPGGVQIKVRHVLKNVLVAASQEYTLQHLLGHRAYFGVTGNARSVKEYFFQAERVLFNWLNRRSQRRSFNWEQYRQWLASWYPQPRVIHALY